MVCKRMQRVPGGKAAVKAMQASLWRHVARRWQCSSATPLPTALLRPSQMGQRWQRPGRAAKKAQTAAWRLRCSSPGLRCSVSKGRGRCARKSCCGLGRRSRRPRCCACHSTWLAKARCGQPHAVGWPAMAWQPAPSRQRTRIRPLAQVQVGQGHTHSGRFEQLCPQGPFLVRCLDHVPRCPADRGHHARAYVVRGALMVCDGSGCLAVGQLTQALEVRRHDSPPWGLRHPKEAAGVLRQDSQHGRRVHHAPSVLPRVHVGRWAGVQRGGLGVGRRRDKHRLLPLRWVRPGRLRRSPAHAQAKRRSQNESQPGGAMKRDVRCQICSSR